MLELNRANEGLERLTSCCGEIYLKNKLYPDGTNYYCINCDRELNTSVVSHFPLDRIDLERHGGEFLEAALDPEDQMDYLDRLLAVQELYSALIHFSRDSGGIPLNTRRLKPAWRLWRLCQKHSRSRRIGKIIPWR